jgi:hypothetical protein
MKNRKITVPTDHRKTQKSTGKPSKKLESFNQDLYTGEKSTRSPGSNQPGIREVIEPESGK